jgi:hypothetical protein
MNARFVALAAAALCLATAAVAPADTPPPSPTPTPVDLPTLPPASALSPYAKAAIELITGLVHGQLVENRNAASGQVTYFKRFELQVRTGANRYRNVHLHQGTKIDPMGQTVRVGQQVSVRGSGQPDGSLNADSIVIQQ